MAWLGIQLYDFFFPIRLPPLQWMKGEDGNSVIPLKHLSIQGGRKMYSDSNLYFVFSAVKEPQLFVLCPLYFLLCHSKKYCLIFSSQGQYTITF